MRADQAPTTDRPTRLRRVHITLALVAGTRNRRVRDQGLAVRRTSATLAVIATLIAGFAAQAALAKAPAFPTHSCGTILRGGGAPVAVTKRGPVSCSKAKKIASYFDFGQGTQHGSYWTLPDYPGYRCYASSSTDQSYCVKHKAIVGLVDQPA